MSKHKRVSVDPTYDALDDKILSYFRHNQRPTLSEIRAKYPRANHSRYMRAMWRFKREANVSKPKLQAVSSTPDAEPLSDLRTMVQEFVQKVSTHPDPIQDMSITITTPKGTVSVRMSQEVKPAGRE